MAGCPGCGGMWLGPDAAVHVMRGLGDALEREAAEASAEVARTSRAPARDTGARACPVCSSLMGRLVVDDIIVDSCSAHGSWFDRDEVAGVVKACGSLRAKQRGEEVDDITAAGILAGAGLIVSGTLSLAWRAFASVAETIADASTSSDADRDDDRW